MMYPFMQLEDGTEIVHSEWRTDGNKEFVKVYVEKPIIGGFHHATCYLPEYRWEAINGFSESEIGNLNKIIESTFDLKNFSDFFTRDEKLRIDSALMKADEEIQNGRTQVAKDYLHSKIAELEAKL